MFLGLGIGFLWCCLTAISLTYLMNARSEMKERHELEEFLKKKKNTLSLLDDEKAYPQSDEAVINGIKHEFQSLGSPNEDQDKQFVTPKVWAGSIALDLSDDKARIEMQEDFRPRSSFSDRLRLKIEDVGGVKNPRETNLRLSSEPSRIDNRSCVQGTESRNSFVGGFALSPSSSSTMESSTAHKARMKSEHEGVRRHRHSLQPHHHELKYQQRMELKMEEGTKLDNNKSDTESSVQISHRERSVSNGKKTENRVPDRKGTVINTDPSSSQKIRRNPVAISKSMVEKNNGGGGHSPFKRRSGTDRRKSSSVVIH